MNCCDVELLLDQLVTSPGHDRIADRLAIREHLAKCSSCRLALDSLARWDGQLTQAMNDIAVPDGLSQRLLAVLNHPDSVDPKSKSVTTTSGLRKAGLRTFAAVTIICLLTVASLWSWRFARPPALSASNVATLLQQPVENLQTTDDFRHLLPRHWASLGRKVVVKGWKQVELSNLRMSVTVIPLVVRLKRGQPVEGSLFVIPKSRWTPTLAMPVSQTPIQYSPPCVWISWSERDLVYILSSNGSAAALEQLQPLLDGNQSVL